MQISFFALAFAIYAPRLFGHRVTIAEASVKPVIHSVKNSKILTSHWVDELSNPSLNCEPSMFRMMSTLFLFSWLLNTSLQAAVLTDVRWLHQLSNTRVRNFIAGTRVQAQLRGLYYHPAKPVLNSDLDSSGFVAIYDLDGKYAQLSYPLLILAWKLGYPEPQIFFGQMNDLNFDLFKMELIVAPTGRQTDDGVLYLMQDLGSSVGSLQMEELAAPGFVVRPKTLQQYLAVIKYLEGEDVRVSAPHVMPRQRWNDATLKKVDLTAGLIDLLTLDPLPKKSSHPSVMMNTRVGLFPARCQATLSLHPK